MGVEVTEVTLKQFVDSTWFKGLARGAMIVTMFTAGYIGTVLATIDSRVTTVEDACEARVVVDDSREQVNAAFRLQMRESLTEIVGDGDAIRRDLGALRSEVSKISGTLEQIQRMQSVSSMMPFAANTPIIPR